MRHQNQDVQSRDCHQAWCFRRRFDWRNTEEIYVFLSVSDQEKRQFQTETSFHSSQCQSHRHRKVQEMCISYSEYPRWSWWEVSKVIVTLWGQSSVETFTCYLEERVDTWKVSHFLRRIWIMDVLCSISASKSRPVLIRRDFNISCRIIRKSKEDIVRAEILESVDTFRENHTQEIDATETCCFAELKRKRTSRKIVEIPSGHIFLRTAWSIDPSSPSFMSSIRSLRKTTEAQNLHDVT